jgi:hypothetical protein
VRNFVGRSTGVHQEGLMPEGALPCERIMTFKEPDMGNAEIIEWMFRTLEVRKREREELACGRRADRPGGRSARCCPQSAVNHRQLLLTVCYTNAIEY